MADEHNYWDAPKIWSDDTAYIIGGGPSVNGLDLSFLECKKVMGVNDAYNLGDWVDVCFFGDKGWFHIHWKDWVKYPEGRYPGLKQFKGLIVTNNVSLSPHPKIKMMYRKRSGIWTLPKCLGWNGNSGAAAINLAVQLGAKRLVLLGFDMKLSEHGDANWHTNLKDKPNSESYIRFTKRFKEVAKALKMINVQCVNASPDSELTFFSKVTYEDAINDRCWQTTTN